MAEPPRGPEGRSWKLVPGSRRAEGAPTGLQLAARLELACEKVAQVGGLVRFRYVFRPSC
eukprot:1308565-Prymnesium_polylepis.1